MKKHYISDEKLDFQRIAQILNHKEQLALSEDAIARIQKCRTFLDEKMARQKEPIYGVNTGFGALYDVTISNEDLSQLQENLVKSHACGVGDEVPKIIVKLMLLLKIQSLSYGHSGVQLKTVNRLIDMYNNNILPIIYQNGSLGASGDLSPLAHMSLPLLAKGKVYYKGDRRDSEDLWKELGWDPIKLQSKEGLALLNGTQFMSAYGVFLCLRVFKLSKLADLIGAISLEAFDGRLEPFHPSVHAIRHHNGQIKTAARVLNILKGSELQKQHKVHVQDPYSFRCIPQVHGASKDSINYVSYVFANEINAVTDNPTIFPDEDLIISAGNFHGQPLALALDNLSIAMAEIGSIAERRTYQLLMGKRNLPSFLVANPGLNSGFMIPQYTAASLVSQNKQLATPASVDTIESSQGQEDHVSMGANAATKAHRILQNIQRVLAIELFTGAQALEFRKPLKSSPFVEGIINAYREKVSFIDDDKIMHTEIAKTVRFLEEIDLELPEEGMFKYEFRTDLKPIQLDTL